MTNKQTNKQTDNKTGGGSWVRFPTSLTHGGASRVTLLRSALYLFVYSSALGKMLSFALKKSNFGVKLEK